MRIEKTPYLEDEVEQKIRALVLRCNAHDGTRSMIKLDNSVQRDPAMDNLFLAWDGASLIGVVKLFHLFRGSVEVSGYVAPEYRRKGIFSTLVGEVGKTLSTKSIDEILFVIDATARPGQDWALGHGYLRQSTEVTMALTGRLPAKAPDAGRTLTLAGPGDLEKLTGLHEAIYGLDPLDGGPYLKKVLACKDKDFLLLKAGDQLIGHGGLYREGAATILFGFGVIEAYRGRGHGAWMLDRLVRRAREEGAQRIELEVDLENQPAYRLYSRYGFTKRHAMDYYREPV